MSAAGRMYDAFPGRWERSVWKSDGDAEWFAMAGFEGVSVIASGVSDGDAADRCIEKWNAAVNYGMKEEAR